MEEIKKYKQDKIVIAHPAQQHSYRLAVALEKADLLDSYCTTVYYKENKLLYKILEFVLGSNNVKRMKNRCNSVFEYKVIEFNEILGLLYLLLARLDKKDRVCTKLYMRLIDKFGKNVANKVIENNSKAIIVYDTTGERCLEKLKSHDDIIKIIDMSSAAAPYILKIINEDMKKNHAFISMHRDKLKFYTEKNCNRFNKEILNADFFLAPSNFVKKSLLDTGVNENKVFIIPYGVDTSKFKEKKRHNKDNEKIRFLYVGRLEAAKGIYYLLEAFKQLNNKEIELVIVGKKCADDYLYDQYKDYFTYEGIKLHSDMPDVYNSCDVFIFPSLWEGLSLSVMEAMASGLPVIISENSGVNDLIIDGREGFTVQTMNIEQLKEKINWFVENREKIETMGKLSRKCAEKYSWDLYEKNVKKAIIQILNKDQGDKYEQ